MRVMHERVAGIDARKDMIKVGIRMPGHRPRAWTRASEVLEYRTFYGVLQTMAADLCKRGVTHVVMEASGVYTEPVYYALTEQDFEQVAVINPAHAKALKGHKTDAKDALRLAELSECGLLRGSYIPSQALKDLRDLTRYRIKTVQDRDRIALFSAAVDDLEARIAVKAAPCRRELELLKSIPGFGDAVAHAWLAEIGPAPHEYFASHEKLASWVTLCPGNHMSAGKRKHGRTGDAGT